MRGIVCLRREQKINKILLCFISLISLIISTQALALEIETPAILLTNVPAEITVSGALPETAVILSVAGTDHVARADVDGTAVFAEIVAGKRGSIALSASSTGSASVSTSLRVLPGWVSITPPLVAILIALTLRNVIPALLIGVWLGAAAVRSFTPEGIFRGLLDGFEVYVAGALSDKDHAAIILFSLMIGGMVGIITRNGGMASIVRLIVSRAKTAMSGQVAVWGMGLMIFFDDYSNTLVVGNTARPITDHLKISREKLAYIVDSTAAPVVCLALITTWIGYEVGLIGEALDNVPDLNEPAYTVFLRSIPYSFYPIFAFLFVLAIAVTGRDFGPMYKAEVRARRGQVFSVSGEDMPSLQSDQLEPKPNIPLRAINAFVPLLVLIGSLIGGLMVTGSGDSITDIIGSANAYKAMMWASLLGAVTAAVMTVGQGILSGHETVDAWFGGVKAMMFAMIVLVLAWALSGVTVDLNTANFLVSVLADTLSPQLVPAIVFALSAITAFTTGTSWGTLGILMPLVIPLTWAVLVANGLADPEHMHILYSAIASNLAGAVWGDHCSPISDTTVLSSMASGCDHIEHVRTQMPYALLAGAVAVFIGTIPGGYGFPPLFSILAGIGVLLLVLNRFGRQSDSAAT
jgi:Na+/H+ antiporter NhaC